MNSPEDVTLQVATEADASTLANLLELYCHDLSAVFALQVGPDGRYGYRKLPRYWAEPETHFAFLIRSGNNLAGFALATRGSPASDDPEVFDVAEFFILRPHRRSGVGRDAAFLLWDRFPGQWIVRVAEANRGGAPFWQSTISDYTDGKFSTSTRLENSRPFQVFSFSSS